jgi:hypothetical protein
VEGCDVRIAKRLTEFSHRRRLDANTDEPRQLGMFRGFTLELACSYPGAMKLGRVSDWIVPNRGFTSRDLLTTLYVGISIYFLLNETFIFKSYYSHNAINHHS